MQINFTKMQGTGNDFILIDCLVNDQLKDASDMPDLCRRLCDRRFGIGADQILLLMPSTKADFRMDIYNADGSKVEMCGNGIRCLARYIWGRGLSEKGVLDIETLAGIIRPERKGNLICVDMGEPVFDPVLIPVDIQQAPPIIDFPISVADRRFEVTCISMGNPHAVIFVDEDLSSMDVLKYGPLIERSDLFPKRTNVEFINIINRGKIRMRVWERGSGETLACGTGACASAVASMLKGFTESTTEVELKGGLLNINWAEDKHIYMTGPAEEVFQGRISI